MSTSDRAKAVFETIRTVLAVRSYQDRPIPEETLTRILDAGRLTASGRNLQPWRFVVVQRKETLRQLGEWASSGPYIPGAAAAIVVALTPGRTAATDTARAIQSMVLQAWSEGVGSNWVGPDGLEPAKELLGIPGEVELIAVVPLGYPAEDIGKGIKNRKPLSEIAHRERWDEPYS